MNNEPKHSEREAFMTTDNKKTYHYSDDRIDAYLAAPQFTGYKTFCEIIEQLRAERHALLASRASKPVGVDVVAALEEARDEACSCNGSMGRCLVHECYDDCIGVVKASLALSAPQDEAKSVGVEELAQYIYDSDAMDVPMVLCEELAQDILSKYRATERK